MRASEKTLRDILTEICRWPMTTIQIAASFDISNDEAAELLGVLESRGKIGKEREFWISANPGASC